MGTSGTSNFGSDCALDYFGDLCDSLIADVENHIDDPELNELGYWADVIPCIAELLVLFDRNGLFGSALPSEATAIEWKDKFLAAWDRCERIVPEFASERRRVISRTFSNLVRRARARDA